MSATAMRPWLVVASAGTVDTGAIDPLPELADLCARHGAWLHVDGAYGGLFALCEEGRALLRGIELADSVALDPHKTLFLPYGTGAALVRDRRHLLASFSASADYIRPLGQSEVGPSPSDLSPELTRHFRGLRLWLPLQMAGLGGISRRPVGKAGSCALFPCAPGRDRRLRPRPAARTLGGRFPLSARRTATPMRSTSG